MKKIAIITGASSGIGKSTAEVFLQDGFEVINISRRPCSLAGVKSLPINLNKANFSSLLPLLTKGSKIVLVHNAAAFHLDTIEAIDSNLLRQMLEVNVIAPSLLNTVVLPFMGEGSSIIYIGSTLSEKAVKNTASYSTSKHAIVGLMRATCQDLAGKNIHTACVCPGFTNTEMFQSRINNDVSVVESIISKVTQGRLVKPSEIADLIFYCSKSAVINGSVIHANLGQVEI
jgi:3-oxoacyl-[acyl-carrier protein] reductase